MADTIRNHFPMQEESTRFDHMFISATGFSAYEYQKRLGCGERKSSHFDHWLSESHECESMLIEIPTGFGKTAAVVLAWLWNRVFRQRDDWPRRLVYCLPMRTLVEQTLHNTRQWLENLELLNKVGFHALMGGEDAGDWDIHPERNAVLVGTQDMLLSRALNRGYGMSRYRWPMHFGLLNNDCLWVMDEVQLMGPALWTSAQLDWMRTHRFKTLKPCFTWWMSATIRPDFLKTVDRKNANILSPTLVSLSEHDKTHETLKASRPCNLWRPPLSHRKRSKNQPVSDVLSDFAYNLAKDVVAEHHEQSLSLVVCNTVSVAQKVYTAICKAHTGDSDIILLTSRFRAQDRKVHHAKLLDLEAARKCVNTHEATSVPGLICVSTQVVEAGVDVSARRLWSEIAPWPSIIQRLGRLNRDGRLNGNARAHFWEWPEKLKKNVGFIGPYEADAVKLGRKLINELAAMSKSDETVSASDMLASLSKRDEIKDLIEKALTPRTRAMPKGH